METPTACAPLCNGVCTIHQAAPLITGLKRGIELLAHVQATQGDQLLVCDPCGENCASSLSLARRVMYSPLVQSRAELLRQLDHIDASVNRIVVPASFGDMFYGLRGHVDFVRHRLMTEPAAHDGPAESAASPVSKQLLLLTGWQYMVFW